MDKVTFLFVAVLFGYWNTAISQNEFLDLQFSEDGKVLLDFNGYESEINALLLQPDGKAIVAGAYFDHGGFWKYYIDRFTTEGIHDTSFGANGRIISQFSGKPHFKSVRLCEDGKILGCGIIYSSGADFSQSFLVRYNPDGGLDNTFGNDGLLIFSDSVNEFVLVIDEKIFVVRQIIDGVLNGRRLYCYNMDGTPDLTFASSGFVNLTTLLGTASLTSMEQDKQGRILFSGSTGSNATLVSPTLGFMARFNLNGTLDAGFAVNGILNLSYDVKNTVKKIATTTDGRILCAVEASHYDDNYVFHSSNMIIRLNNDGNLDTTFGVGGILPRPYPDDSMEVLTDGKILLGFRHPIEVTDPIPRTSHELGITQLLSNGTVDTDFGQNGMITDNSLMAASNVLVRKQGNDKVVVGLTYGPDQMSTHPNAALFRFNTASTLSGVTFSTDNNRFQVYPNPIEETMYLKFYLKQPEKLSVALYDANGRKIENLLLHQFFGSGQHLQQLHLSSVLSRGLYFLKITSGTNIISVKLIK